MKRDDADEITGLSGRCDRLVDGGICGGNMDESYHDAPEQETDIGGSQADLAGHTQSEQDEVEIRAQQITYETAAGMYSPAKALGKILVLVRDAVDAKDERIANLEQRIGQLAAAVEASRDVRLERDRLRAANVALGHEKELALTDAYRTNEALRAELAQWEIKWGHTLDRESETMVRLAQAEQERDEIRQHYSLARAAEELFKTERDMERSEVGRLHSLLERANALLPPDDPVNQEIEREFETCAKTINACTKTIEGLRAEVNDYAVQRNVNERLRADLAAARRDAREMAKAIGKALDESRNGTWANAVERMVEQLSGLDADLTEYVDGGE